MTVAALRPNVLQDRREVRSKRVCALKLWSERVTPDVSDTLVATNFPRPLHV